MVMPNTAEVLVTVDDYASGSSYVSFSTVQLHTLEQRWPSMTGQNRWHRTPPFHLPNIQRKHIPLFPLTVTIEPNDYDHEIFTELRKAT